MFEKEGIEVILLPHIIDTQFAQLLESVKEGVKFCRVDSELADSMKGDAAEENTAVAEIFKKIVPEGTEIKFESLKDASLPAVLNVNEDSRRMEEFMKMYSGMGAVPPMPTNATLILNTSCPVIGKLSEKDGDKANLIAKQVYNLCLLTQSRMTSETLKSFLSDSFNILGMI